VFFGIGAMTVPGMLALLSRHFALPTIVSAIGFVTLVPAAWFLLIRFPPPKQRGEPYSIGRSFGCSGIPCSCWRAWRWPFRAEWKACRTTG